MNNETHTPEPWFIGDTPGYLALGQWKDGKSRFSDPITIRSASHTEEIATVWTYLLPTDANARRIVACVNYCAGIPTKLLEERAVTEWEDSIQRQRDALAEALRKLLKAYDSIMPGIGYIAVQDYTILNDAPLEARAALAKLK